MIRAIAPVALTLFLAAPVAAQEFVTTDGKLSDSDFFRLVTCSAAPGGPCGETLVRWTDSRASDLRVALLPAPRDYPGRVAERVSRALDRAIEQINGAGSAVRMRRVGKSEASDIQLHLAPVRSGDLVYGTGVDGLDDESIGAAVVQVRWDGKRNITEAAIVMAEDIPRDEIYPVLLEELTQSLGFLTDIRNPYYDSLSVFSEDSNSVTKLGVQDRMALHRLYPQN